MAKFQDLTGQVFGDFKAIEYLGDKYWLVECTNCGETKRIQTARLKRFDGVTCSRKKPPVMTIKSGDTFGEWEVLKYVGDKKYLCRCSCGNERIVLRCNLVRGSSTSCGCYRNNYGDLTGKTINEWKVLGKENYLYKCQCSCGKIQLVGSKDLMTGRSKSCGHGYNEFNDLTGKTFGNWEVIKYIGNQMYLCRCSCENHTEKAVRRANLLKGASTSCGCNIHIKAQNTLLERYGDLAPNKSSNPRSIEQIEAVQSRDNLEAFIRKHSADEKIPQTDLAELLGLTLSRTLVIVKTFNLDELVKTNCGQSKAERDLAKWLKEHIKSKMELKNRTLLNGKEIDIYFPEKHIGIEYNGNYWHQELLKYPEYHQKKSLDAYQKGIRLIHIFEYEWRDTEIQRKLKDYLKSVLQKEGQTRLYARDTIVCNIESNKSYDFQEKYHLQGQSSASIHIGIYSKYDESKQNLLGIMTFGKPRFNNDYEYELIRMCFKPDVTILGGAQKMFKCFVNTYNPSQIITYQDISKFTGKVYKQLGMDLIQKDTVTAPNYVWVRLQDSTFLRRYQTTKQKLVSNGLGTENETEKSIMEGLGYVKVHDCGQLRYEYKAVEGG